MKLFSFQTANHETNIGVQTKDGYFNLTCALDIFQKSKNIPNTMPFTFLQVFVELGYCSGEMIEQIFNSPWVQSKQASLEIEEPILFNEPISRPSKIICIGRNYVEHAKELNHDVPQKEPVFFNKAPSSILRHEGQIEIPSWLNSRVDHEAELAVVIGKQGKNISEADAMDYVAGYTILNDVTARAMQKEDIANGKPWFRSKSLDTFCPTGPCLIPADTVSDPHNLDIELKVNSETRQKSSTSKMIFKIPQLIAYVSKFMTLEPADIIATGTPEGVSPIQSGDQIEITVSKLGTLKNIVSK